MRLVIYSLSVTALLFGAAFIVGEMQAVEAVPATCVQSAMHAYDQCLANAGEHLSCSAILQSIRFVCN